MIHEEKTNWCVNECVQKKEKTIAIETIQMPVIKQRKKKMFVSKK